MGEGGGKEEGEGREKLRYELVKVMTHNICDCVDPRSCVHDENLLGVFVGLVNGLNVCLVLLTSLLARTDQWLAAACNGGVGDGMKP